MVLHAFACGSSHCCKSSHGRNPALAGSPFGRIREPRLLLINPVYVSWPADIFQHAPT
jgi:hypothetical protein